jgi:hypothetical protein
MIFYSYIFLDYNCDIIFFNDDFYFYFYIFIEFINDYCYLNFLLFDYNFLLLDYNFLLMN